MGWTERSPVAAGYRRRDRRPLGNLGESLSAPPQPSHPSPVVPSHEPPTGRRSHAPAVRRCMVVIPRKVEQAVDHEARDFVERRMARISGPPTNRICTEVDFAFDHVRGVREIEREHVGWTVFPAELPVETADLRRPRQDNPDVTAAARLFGLPEVSRGPTQSLLPAASERLHRRSCVWLNTDSHMKAGQPRYWQSAVPHDP